MFNFIGFTEAAKGAFERLQLFNNLQMLLLHVYKTFFLRMSMNQRVQIQILWKAQCETGVNQSSFKHAFIEI